MSELQKKLDENIPRDVISTRSGGGAKQLSYLETWYVIDRMNQVFGSTGWSQEIKELTLLPGSGKPSYRAIVRLEVHHRISQDKSDYSYKEGVGYGSDKSDHNAHELAMKEAVSDAFKVAAKNLGRSMGLALYDKTQEFVDESPKAEPVKRQETKTAKAPNTDLARASIKQAFGILQAQKKITKEDFIRDYTKGSKVDDLTDAQVVDVLNQIKANFKELGL